MQSDLPHVLYMKNKKDKSDPKKNTKASDEVVRLQEEANRRFLEMKKQRERGERQYELEELFR